MWAQSCKGFVFSKPHGQFLIESSYLKDFTEMHMCYFPASEQKELSPKPQQGSLASEEEENFSQKQNSK